MEEVTRIHWLRVSVGTDWCDQIEADRLCVVWVSVLCFSSVL